MLSRGIILKANHIKQKMILVIFITLIPLSILKISEIKRGLETSIQAELEANQDYAKALSYIFMNFVERTWSNQYVMGKDLITHHEEEKGEISTYFKSIVLTDKPFKIQYYWANPQGIIVGSSEDLYTTIDISGRAGFKDIVNGREKIIGDLEYSVINGEPIISIARGIRRGGELRGVIINTIKVKDIKSIIPISEISLGSTFGLVDRKGVVTYSHGENIIDSHPAIELNGMENVYVDYPIKEIGWRSFVNTPMERLLATRQQDLLRDITIFVLVYIISFLMAILMSGKFVESVEKLKLAAYKVKNGDLSIKTEIHMDDDLGDVGQAFDSMIETLRERAREAEECNDLKSQFLASISHEFKTPLNIILGTIQILELSNTNDEDFQKLFNKYIKMQKQNSYRLLRLISNFIDITKVENNYIKTKFRNDNIIKVVEDITLSVVEYTKLKDINIIFDTDMEEKITSFDADMLERIILNLLSNSIKFTEPGGTIEVSICTEENIRISIKDTGIGIPEDKIRSIFNRYVQVENHLKRASEGSGIGLSLVKSLVELHEGSISVESKLGSGTTVVIELPDKTIEGFDITKDEENTYNIERIHVEFSDIYV